MENNKDEIRLDKADVAANEGVLPEDNVIKTTESPERNLNVSSGDNDNLTQAGSPALGNSPDFANKETKENTASNDQ